MLLSKFGTLSELSDAHYQNILTLPVIAGANPVRTIQVYEKLIPYQLKFRWLKVTKSFKNVVTFNRRNNLTNEINNRRKFLTDEYFWPIFNFPKYVSFFCFLRG